MELNLSNCHYINNYSTLYDKKFYYSSVNHVYMPIYMPFSNNILSYDVGGLKYKCMIGSFSLYNTPTIAFSSFGYPNGSYDYVIGVFKKSFLTSSNTILNKCINMKIGTNENYTGFCVTPFSISYMTEQMTLKPLFMLAVEKQYILKGGLSLDRIDSKKLMLFCSKSIMENEPRLKKRFNKFKKEMGIFCTAYQIPYCEVDDISDFLFSPIPFQMVKNVRIENSEDVIIRTNANTFQTKLLV